MLFSDLDLIRALIALGAHADARRGAAHHAAVAQSKGKLLGGKHRAKHHDGTTGGGGAACTGGGGGDGTSALHWVCWGAKPEVRKDGAHCAAASGLSPLSPRSDNHYNVTVTTQPPPDSLPYHHRVTITTTYPVRRLSRTPELHETIAHVLLGAGAAADAANS